jgi:hypothetical protein
LALVYSPCVVGSSLIHVADVDMVLVQLELIGRQNPARLWSVSQSLRPPRWSYYLVGPSLRRDAGKEPTHLQDFRGSGVAFGGPAVHPPDVSGPAVKVGVGQATGLAVALWDARAVRDAWQEVVTLFEGLDADSMLSGYDSEAAMRRWSTTPDSRSPAACGVAPKLGFSRSLRASVLTVSGSPRSRNPRSHIPLPTPGGRAGLKSTSSRVPQEVSRSAAFRSNTKLTIARRDHGKIQPCSTQLYYDVPEESGRELGARMRTCGLVGSTMWASHCGETREGQRYS